jgi:dihydropyrimidinase
VIPGAIDTHVHIGLGRPGTPLARIAEDFRTESVGALYGVVTTILSYLPQRSRYSDLIDEVVKMGLTNSCVDFGFHAILGDNYEWNELSKIIDRGVTSFKFYFTAYRGREGEQIGVSATSTRTLFEAFRRLDPYGPGVVAIIHAEDQDIIDSIEAEAKAAEHDDILSWARSRPELCCVLATTAAARIAATSRASCMIAHMSTGAEVDIVAEANARMGTSVAIETCPHYLALDEAAVVGELGVLGKVNPTIKTRTDSDRLWQGIRTAEVSCVGSDHCPYTMAEKIVDADRFHHVWDSPPGLPNGLEHMVPILWTEGIMRNRISIRDLVAVASDRPARLFGLHPRKGSLQLGADADFVVIDSRQSFVVGPGTLHTRASDWSPFWAKHMAATVTHSFVRGKAQLVDRILDKLANGFGQFLTRPV